MGFSERPSCETLTKMAAAARPLVSVYNGEGELAGNATMPKVFLAPIRQDVVQFVHSEMSKNKRQPYAVSRQAGHQTSQSPGALVVLLLGSPVCVVVEPTDLARV